MAGHPDMGLGIEVPTLLDALRADCDLGPAAT